MTRRIVSLALLIALALGAGDGLGAARAQGPDAWTNIDLNLRAGPGGDYAVIAVLPPDTPLVIEAHGGTLTWLLGHSEDGSLRGWVASGYLRYREGFAAVNLPASDEIVTPPADAPAAALADPAPDATEAVALDAGPEAGSGSTADGAIAAKTLLYRSSHAEYYRLTYYSDGLRINGFLGVPLAEGPHPAIILNRGGMWDSGALTGAELAPLVECGYVVAASQYRGNAGSEGLETFGWDDVHDVLNLIPLLRAMPQVDAWRIGMMGGSRGGMMTYLALKEQSLRGENWIRAAVTIGGIADLFLWYEQNPDLTTEVYSAIIGALPSENPAPYVHRSATHWPELINVPLMLLHGGADTTVPPEQSQRLHDALKAAGKDVTLVIFPEDDHQLTGQYGGYPIAVGFFNRLLGGDGVDRGWESHSDGIGEALRWFDENG